MSAMPASGPLTPFILCRQKPQAKTLSPVSRSLFGHSDASLVKDMLSEVLITERRKAASELNFDVYNEKPLTTDQQENISDVDKTPESRKRFFWKAVEPSEAPEFYSRRYKGKNSLMPVDLSNCSPELSTGRAKYVRRSLNGYLRSPSSDCEPRRIASPLRATAFEKNVNEPSSFEDGINCEFSELPKPLAVHATTENALTAKALTPSKRLITCRPFQRSPLAQRENQSRISRVLDFNSTPKKSSFVRTSNKVVESTINSDSCTSQNPTTPTPSDVKSTTPMHSTSSRSVMKQLKITDMATIRKSRSPAIKARKRLRLLDDKSVNFSAPKSQKLAKKESC